MCCLTDFPTFASQGGLDEAPVTCLRSLLRFAVLFFVITHRLQHMETEVNSNMEMYVTVPLKVAHHLSKTQVYLSAKTSGVNFSLLRSTVSHGTTKKDRVYQPSLL